MIGGFRGGAVLLYISGLFYRLYRLLARLYVLLIGLAVVMVFVLMGLSLIFKSSGSPAFNRLIHADGFFPWPVAAMFALMQLAPAVLIVGLAGGVVGAMLRRLVLLRSDAYTAQVVAIRQTGGSVNGKPRMSLTLSASFPSGLKQVTVRPVVDLGSMPRVGDRVRLVVSRVDPTCMSYGGPIGGA
jgi:hypothetical protein